MTIVFPSPRPPLVFFVFRRWMLDRPRGIGHRDRFPSTVERTEFTTSNCIPKRYLFLLRIETSFPRLLCRISFVDFLPATGKGVPPPWRELINVQVERSRNEPTFFNTRSCFPLVRGKNINISAKFFVSIVSRYDESILWIATWAIRISFKRTSMPPPVEWAVECEKMLFTKNFIKWFTIGWGQRIVIEYRVRVTLFATVSPANSFYFPVLKYIHCQPTTSINLLAKFLPHLLTVAKCFPMKILSLSLSFRWSLTSYFPRIPWA